MLSIDWPLAHQGHLDSHLIFKYSNSAQHLPKFDTKVVKPFTEQHHLVNYGQVRYLLNKLTQNVHGEADITGLNMLKNLSKSVQTCT